MSLQVFFVHGFLYENFLTNNTHPAELLRVTLSHVLAQFVPARESLATRGTRQVTRLALVFDHVLLVVRALIESFTAVLTVKGELASVHLHVSAQTR